jgi:hypothetical protein
LGYFWLIFKFIFGLFSSIWQRNKQKETKNGTENNVKKSYHETPGKGNLEKWSKNAFFSLRHKAKKMKNDHFSVPFLQKRG